MSDESGKEMWRREQEPFGADTFLRGSITENLRMPGQYWDSEKSCSYNFYRDTYYPNWGRYGQPDPIGQKGGINLYTYANSAPINLTDPKGEFVAVIAVPIIIWGGSTTIGEIIGAATIGGIIGYIATEVEKHRKCGRDDDDNFCYKRWEQEDTECWDWKGLGIRVVKACQQRASIRRDLCIRNGGKPNPCEPPKYSPFRDYPR